MIAFAEKNITNVALDHQVDVNPLTGASDLNANSSFGDLFTADVKSQIPNNPVGEHNITIINAGLLLPEDAPDDVPSSDPSTIDENELKDICIYIEYGLDEL